jgi:hypothetical protein
MTYCCTPRPDRNSTAPFYYRCDRVRLACYLVHIIVCIILICIPASTTTLQPNTTYGGTNANCKIITI